MPTWISTGRLALDDALWDLGGDRQSAALVHGLLLAVIGLGVLLIKYVI